jgi:hypothetical protein
LSYAANVKEKTSHGSIKKPYDSLLGHEKTILTLIADFAGVVGGGSCETRGRERLPLHRSGVRGHGAEGGYG